MEATAGKRGSRGRPLAAALALAATALIAIPSSAAAYHIPGAVYSGYVSYGGGISFAISGDGSQVTNLTITGPITTTGCTWNGAQYSQPVPIASNSFNNGQVSGSFTNVQGAYGHFDVTIPGLPSSCRITGSWSAFTTASPAGSDECKSAQAQVKQRKRALHKAKKSGNAKKIRKARGSWAAARNLRDQLC